MLVEQISLDRHGAILQVTNSDPKTRNAIGIEFYEGFIEVLQHAARDKEIAVVLLTGGGGFFCSGGNIHALHRRTQADAAGRRAGVDRLHELIRTMRGLGKPIIAAVEGGAAGAGISVALACDFIIAARKAAFSAGHVKIGLTPDGGATAFIGRALPHQLAMEMCMLGMPLSAERLAEFGIVNRLTEKGEALAAAHAFAHQLSNGPPRAYGRIKSLIDQAAVSDLNQQLDAEAVAMAASLGDEEAGEGIAAFFEKRAPKFRA